MTVFPSVEWLQQVADLAMNDATYKKFGRVDTLVGVKVDDRQFALTFDVFTIRDIREVGEDDLRDLDFYLTMPPSTWQEMIEDIKQHGQAGPAYTLNTLDLKLPARIAANALGDDYRMDKFFRFNQSLQRFFDLSDQIATEFAPVRQPASTSAG